MFCYSIILSFNDSFEVDISDAIKSVPNPQTIPQNRQAYYKYLKSIFERKYHYCMMNPNFICKFCIFIKNISIVTRKCK